MPQPSLAGRRSLAIAPMVGFLMADDVTVVETFTLRRHSARRGIRQYAEVMDGLMGDAATGDDARALINSALRALEG